MTKARNQQYVIISAELTNLSEFENKQRTDRLESWLNDLNVQFTKSFGTYNNKTENSFFVNVNNNEELNTLMDYAFKNFNQESILYSDRTGTCWLEFRDSSTEKLGTMRQVSPKLVESLKNYVVVNGTVLTTENV